VNDLPAGSVADEATRRDSRLNDFALSRARMSSTVQTWRWPLPTLFGGPGPGK